MKRKNLCGGYCILILLTLVLAVLLGVFNSSYAAEAKDVKNILKTDNIGLLSVDLPGREGVKIGELIFHSALRAETQYDSNIYLEHRNENSDVINVINPSFGLKLPMQDNDISLEYDATFNYFSRYPANDHIDHRVTSLAELNWTDYKITLRDTYRRYKDRTGTEDVNRTKRQTNNIGAVVETKELNRMFLSFGYINNLESYLSADPIMTGLSYRDKSYIEQAFNMILNYRMYSKTYFMWENDYGTIHYYKNSIPADSYYIESLIGVKSDLTSKLGANIKVGARYQEYEESPLLNDDGYFNAVARGGLDYFAGKDDTYSLNVERSTYESTFDDMNYYELNSLGLNYAHKFNHKLTGNLFTSVQENLYPKESTVGGVTKKRKDKIYYFGCSLKYIIQKWLSLEGKYQFERRDSNFSAFSYTDNLVSVACTIGF